MRKLTVALMMGTLLSLAACDRGSSGQGTGVAVLDLDKVAKTMGWLDDIQNNLKQNDSDLRGQLEEVLKTRIKTIEDKKNEVAKEAKLTPEQTQLLKDAKDARELEALHLSKEQLQQLAETVARANNEWQAYQNKYMELMQTQRARLILGYREKVRPIAGRVAAGQGAAIVLIPAESLLYYDPRAVDITEKVIDELQKLPAPTPPATTQPSR